MKKDLGHYRKNYSKFSLNIEATPEDPMVLFERWFHEVETLFPDIEVNAMTLSTVQPDSSPLNRIVLLKEFSSEGFVFYTNYNSAKGKAILNNPKVCLSFFWEKAERQVIVTGKATKVSYQKSNAYFKSRPLESQLAAILSQQSSILNEDTKLDEELLKLTNHYINLNETPSMPEHWGGFIVVPNAIEFWQGRPNRLHQRIKYICNSSSFDKIRLYP